MSEYEKRAGEVFVILQKDLLWKKSVVKYNKDIKSAHNHQSRNKNHRNHRIKLSKWGGELFFTLQENVPS